MTARIALRHASSHNEATRIVFLADQYRRAQDLTDEWQMERAERSVRAAHAIVRHLVGVAGDLTAALGGWQKFDGAIPESMAAHYRMATADPLVAEAEKKMEAEKP